MIVNCGYMRLYICQNCKTPGETQNPNQMFCPKAPCQEAKKQRKNAQKRDSDARLKKRRALASSGRDRR